MKSMNSKLVLSAIAIALLATSAFAQPAHRVGAHPAQFYNSLGGTYPNPVARSGSEESVESGAAFNVDRGY
jgi:hypothetical protein